MNGAGGLEATGTGARLTDQAGVTMPNERQIPVPIEEEMRKSYLDYAMSVIVGRALPDIRDGLKPVHRRVLYTMQGLGLSWNRAYKKAARVIGDCMGKYHPHGDAPIYEALVRMVQEFSLRYPLVDGQGNYGSVDGDPPAAMRYTEARLAKIAHEMLADIDKDTVDFVPNFDESEREPVVLPTRIPNLLDQRLGRASRWAWPPTSRRTTSPRSSTALVMLVDNAGDDDRAAAEDRQGPRLSDARLHLRRRRHPRGVHDRAAGPSRCARRRTPRRCGAGARRSSSPSCRTR